MGNLANNINSAINKGTNATTLAAGVTDKFNKLGTQFGFVQAQAPNKDAPKRDTGIRPIGDFISMMKNVGLAKQNNYTFEFMTPLLYGGEDNNTLNLRDMQLLCASCVLPGVNIDTVPVRSFGETYQMPNDKTYGTMSSTFYVDNHFLVKKMFDVWTNKIMNRESRTFEFYDNYTTQVSITVFDKYGYPHYEMTLEDAYPKSISDIQLSQDNHDFMKVDITWSYRRWTAGLLTHSVHPDADDSAVKEEREKSIHDNLMGYVGDFKGYQNRFNSITGDISRSKSLIKQKDWGGMVGQNFGGGAGGLL